MRLTHGAAWLDIDPVGSTIAEAVLQLDGQPVRPLFQNPWRDDPRDMDNLTRHLGGEWPCVPFGVAHAPETLPQDWRCRGRIADWHRHAHGYAAHSNWALTQTDAQTLAAQITYPQSSPIAALRRSIHLASETEIQLGLEIEVRRDVKIPAGVHPVISLQDAPPGSARLQVAGDQSAWTFPIEVEPNRSHLKPDQRAVPLSALIASDGTKVDATCLPFAAKSEDLVLLTTPGGRVSLCRPELGYRVDVHWNEQDFPSCLLWLSNRGRDYAPWDGRVCAIGIEPVAAAFDLGVDHSLSSTTPLARHGTRNFLTLRAGEPWRTSYAISLHRRSEAEPDGAS